MESARIASFVEVDLDALTHNASVLRRLVPEGGKLGGVVKGNAYGHGLREVLPAVHPVVDVLYVVTAQDAWWIRSWESRVGAPRREVLVLGVLSPEEVVRCGREGVSVVLSDGGFEAHARAVAAAGVSVDAHVHLETGLSREGLWADRLAADLSWLAQVGPAVSIRGALMHFADVEDVTEQDWALHQLSHFERGVLALEALLADQGRPTQLVRHAAASAAAMVLSASRLDVIRPGISLYGLWPSRETRISARMVLGDLPPLRPVLSWRVPVQAVKDVPTGQPASYGCTWIAPRPSRLAVLPVGYFDGFPRRAGNRAQVLVGGRRCPLVGRVMMNHLLVDVTEVPSVQHGDLATLIGRDGDAVVSAEALAEAADTIHYEIVTRIAEHVPRVPVGGSSASGAPG